MFFDIGPLELIALIILATIVFGPDKLPKVIQDATRFIRKVREFSDSAKEDIRKELGPEFKDFEFEDLNPKNFAKKHLLDNDDLGLKEIRNGFDLKKEVAEVGEAARTVGDMDDDGAGKKPLSLTKDGGSGPDGRSDAAGEAKGTTTAERPPYDADAT
ncbi:sec-independent translocase [Streptomyces sp. WMMC500]|uniref:sec-independent translocase n=1 Tax=Streptomyces sp. WMMC500 TaxID=3015154 RepID=UPI00248C43AB|nr:sec-independent translocase [Streptomyces sp. WMMC500]WBB63284.1 sec-independent translocase [Streptomyces sp. WMMC500]